MEQQISTTIHLSICELLHQLTRTNKELEMVADELDEGTLRSAVDGLSNESYQYANELSSELKTLGISCNEPGLTLQELQGIIPAATDESGNEVLGLCNKNENLLIKAYQAVLSAHLPFPSLKELMVFQLSAITSGFLKLKALGNLRIA